MALHKSKPLRLGFVPLIDSAPLVMAQELGLFAKHELNVELLRQPVKKAQWILEHLLRLGAIQDRTGIRTLASGAVFWADLYEEARKLIHSSRAEPYNPDALELTPA